MHNEWFRNKESIDDETKVDLLEEETKNEGLRYFVEKLEERCTVAGADYILFLEEFKIGKAMSSWSFKGTFQFLLKISTMNVIQV